MSEDFGKMTVLELRRVAKEMGVVLGAGISKQGIVDKLNAAAQLRTPSSTPSAPASTQQSPISAERPVRNASIIADDGYDDHDDIPVLTPNRGFTPRRVTGVPRTVTPPSPSPLSRQPAQASPVAPRASSLSSISSKAPAFTMEGSRTWHNPRTYQSQQPYQQRTPQFTGISNRPLPTSSGDTRPITRSARPDQPFRAQQPSYVSRFGPDYSAQGDQRINATIPDQAPRGYEQPGYYRNDPQQPDQRALRDYRPEMAEDYTARYAAPVAQQQPVSQAAAINEVLAAGECGDGEGVLEVLPDGFGFLRSENYLSGRKDIYIANAQVKRFGLRSGDYVVGKTRKQRDNDRFAAMIYITEVNGKPADELPTRPLFEDLTPIYPKKRIVLSGKESSMALKLIDMISPIGFGQRALIVSPQRAARMNLLIDISKTITLKYPDVTQMMLLIDQRPEDVTEIKEQVQAQVISSSFDESPDNQIRSSELLLEHAMRLAESGGNVVLLLDSITRLTYAYNTVAPASARMMAGGLVAGAMNKPKRLFGAARNIKQGGSLTVIATALTETGNTVDDMTIRELKGTSNMDALLAVSPDKRVLPALNIEYCGTRHDELLLNEKELAVSKRIRDMLLSGDEGQVEQVYMILEKTRDTRDLAERFDSLIELMRG